MENDLKLRIVIEPNGMSFRATCQMCCTTFELSDPQPVFYGDDGKKVGDVCPVCFDELAMGGEIALAAHLKKLAEENDLQLSERLRFLARENARRSVDLLERAAEVLTGIDIVQTGETFRGINGLARDKVRRTKGNPWE